MSQTAERSAIDSKQKAQFFSDVTDIWSLENFFLGEGRERDRSGKKNSQASQASPLQISRNSFLKGKCATLEGVDFWISQTSKIVSKICLSRTQNSFSKQRNLDKTSQGFFTDTSNPTPSHRGVHIALGLKSTTLEKLIGIFQPDTNSPCYNLPCFFSGLL